MSRLARIGLATALALVGLLALLWLLDITAPLMDDCPTCPVINHGLG